MVLYLGSKKFALDDFPDYPAPFELFAMNRFVDLKASRVYLERPRSLLHFDDSGDILPGYESTRERMGGILDVSIGRRNLLSIAVQEAYDTVKDGLGLIGVNLTERVFGILHAEEPTPSEAQKIISAYLAHGNPFEINYVAFEFFNPGACWEDGKQSVLKTSEVKELIGFLESSGLKMKFFRMDVSLDGSLHSLNHGQLPYVKDKGVYFFHEGDDLIRYEKRDIYRVIGIASMFPEVPENAVKTVQPFESV